MKIIISLSDTPERGDDLVTLRRPVANLDFQYYAGNPIMHSLIRRRLNGTLQPRKNGAKYWFNGKLFPKKKKLKVKTKVITSMKQSDTSISSKPQKYTITLVTGPLRAGKSTFKRELCKALGTKVVDEYQPGADISHPNWWVELQEEAKFEKTKVLELHLQYKRHDAGEDIEIIPSEVKVPPKEVSIYFVLPSLDKLFRQQKLDDKYTTEDLARRDLEWYNTIYDILKAGGASVHLKRSNY